MRRHLPPSVVVFFILTVSVFANPSVSERSPVVADAQDLVRVWTGTWTGSSFGRNNPGEAQPTSPVSGTWILDVQAVDPAHNTASGTLTWNGRDAFWTYEFLPNGKFVATAHDFIPNRTIQFNSSNTTLTSPAPGAGPQFHLTIEGFANKPNPSDAFYGPWFSVDIFPTSGEVVSQGIGFSTHPYNPANFDTAFSNGSVSGGVSMCTPGQTFSNVMLPEITVPHSYLANQLEKFWIIRWGQLGLNFTTESPPPNALCKARSNRGSLNILGAPATHVGGMDVPLTPFITFGHTDATATLTIFKGSALGGLSSCVFVRFLGPRNNCLLNGSFDPNAYYAMWNTDGFSVGINVLRDRGVKDFIHTPPFTFFVNLDERNLSPKTKDMEAIVRGVEPFIHTTLMKNLPLISFFTFLQDPGQVTLFVVKDGVLGTGVTPSGEVVTQIPRSLYFESPTDPTVILLEPDAGNYKVFVKGVAAGDYKLSALTTNLPEEATQEVSVSGNIGAGNTVIYDLTLASSANGMGQNFNTTPVQPPAMELVMEDTGTQAAALDSVSNARDPFPVANPKTVITRGSDVRTRVQLFVAYLQLAPGEPTSSVTVEARDSANNVYPLEVEDVRSMPNTTLTQVTVRLSENLPNGLLSVRVRFHERLTSAGTILIQK